MASVVFGHVYTTDDWACFNHHRFPVVGVISGDTLLIDTGGKLTQTVRLLGIAAPTENVESPSGKFLASLAGGHQVTLMLTTPQTRDDQNRLLAFVFVDGADLSVELAKAGMVYADHRQPDVMSGLIDPAESEARKKKRGLWQDLKYEQMPPWKQAWLRGIGQQTRIHH